MSQPEQPPQRRRRRPRWDEETLRWFADHARRTVARTAIVDQDVARVREQLDRAARVAPRNVVMATAETIIPRDPATFRHACATYAIAAHDAEVTIARLTAERDAARHQLAQIRDTWWRRWAAAARRAMERRGY